MSDFVLTPKAAPSAIAGKTIFWIDSSDGLLRSIDENSVVTIYNRTFEDASAPTSGDDDTLGYRVGDFWLKSTTNVYVCLDATDGAAVWFDITAGSGGEPSDGDKGDITVSSSGTVWTIDNGIITLAKMANLAANSLIGNNTGSPATPIALTASQVKTLLSLTVGTDVQAYSAVLATLTGASANGQSLITAADYSAMRTLLGLVIGTNVQAQDAELSALAGLTSAADKFPYFTGAGTASLLTIVSAIRTLLASADVATFRSNAGLAIGTNVQAWDADLDTLATMTRSGNGTALATTSGALTQNKQLEFDANGNVVASASDIGGAGSSVPPVDSVVGLALSNNGTDAVNDIDIALGKAADATGAVLMSLVSGITKRLDASWSVGTNQGGLDTGSKANSTWYHVWLIKRSDTGVVDVLFSTSVSAPTMPTNYDYKRRIGAIKTDSGGSLLAFLQYGDSFIWKSPPALDVDTAALGTSRTNYTLASVPTGLVVRANFNAWINCASAAYVYISNPNMTDLAAAESATPLAHIGASGSSIRPFTPQSVFTDSSAQISARSSNASTQFRVAVTGWIDPRGKY